MTPLWPLLALVSASAPPVQVDAVQVKTLAAFARRADRVARTWYPKIADALGVDRKSLPAGVKITIDLEADGVAATGGTEITVSARYAAKHPNDLGMIVHELTHVVQRYPKYDPVWLVEGVADYVRFFVYEPETRINLNPDRADCRQSYRTTAAFLAWAQAGYDKSLVRKIDAALKAGTFTEADFERWTGKSLDALNAEWKASLRAR